MGEADILNPLGTRETSPILPYVGIRPQGRMESTGSAAPRGGTVRETREENPDSPARPYSVTIRFPHAGMRIMCSSPEALL